MKYIAIILLSCSCSATYTVNGHQIKQKKKMHVVDAPVLICSFYIGYAIIPLLVHK